MSNGLAIAAVSRVLQDLLESGLSTAKISTAVGGKPEVKALPPDRVLGNDSTNEKTLLNLYLHQVTPNPGWSSRDLPTRDGRFDRVANPLLALDLHFLLSAYTEDEFEGEILLGYAMQLLHENAILSREYVRDILENLPSNNSAPPAVAALANSGLADQVELIKIRPQRLSVDDMSKLWTAFQTHYRTTAAYEVSVVLIESEEPKRTPLPVLSRGRPDAVTGRDEGVHVQASLIPPVPTLTTVVPPNQQFALRLGETVTLNGYHLADDQVTVRFLEERSNETLVLPAASAIDGMITIALPPPPPVPPPAPPPPAPPANSPENPANWRAGIYRVRALFRSATGEERTTNALPLVLAPLVQKIEAAVASGTVTFTVTCSPPVRDTQTVSLIVGAHELFAEPIGAEQVTEVEFKGSQFTSGEKLPVRLRVDGIESILIDRTAKPPVFDPSQQVTIP